MTRLTDTILSGRAYGKGLQAPLVDLKNGGQFGWSTDHKSWVSNAAFVRRNVIARLVAAPRGFADLDEPQLWVETLKALIEERAKTIDGLQGELTVDYAANPFGGAGEEQEDPTNVTRARSTPNFTWTEAYNRAINAFWEGYITNLIMDPITKYPNVLTRGVKPSDLLPDYFTFTTMFIEPDPTHTKVVKAWLCANMAPKGAGAVEGRSDKAGGGETQDLSVEFTAITQVGLGVNLFAQRMLDEMNLTGANPNHRPAFIDSITADVARGAKGYAEQIAAAGASAIQP
jgi:hypothetical protein